jgi:hypothetical protein
MPFHFISIPLALVVLIIFSSQTIGGTAEQQGSAKYKRLARCEFMKVPGLPEGAIRPQYSTSPCEKTLTRMNW